MSLTQKHQVSALVPQNEVLLITGSIELADNGNASAVLFNGTTFQPFILTTTSNGGQGTLSGMFVQNPGNFLSSNCKFSLHIIPSLSFSSLTPHSTPPRPRSRCPHRSCHRLRVDFPTRCYRHPYRTPPSPQSWLCPYETTASGSTCEPQSHPTGKSFRHVGEERYGT